MKNKYSKFILLSVILSFLVVVSSNNLLAVGDPIYQQYIDTNTGTKYAYNTVTPPGGSWTANGVQFNAHKTQVSGTVPIYQLYWSAGDSYLYSTVNSGSGMSSDGVAFYAFKTQVPGTIPIYQMFRVSKHHYSPLDYSRDGWNSDGVAFYAYPGNLEGCNYGGGIWCKEYLTCVMPKATPPMQYDTSYYCTIFDSQTVVLSSQNLYFNFAELTVRSGATLTFITRYTAQNTAGCSANGWGGGGYTSTVVGKDDDGYDGSGTQGGLGGNGGTIGCPGQSGFNACMFQIG